VALTTDTGGITLTGVISAAGDTLDLISAGAISQSGGSIHVATLTGSAGTSASLTRANNLVGTLAAFTTSTGFALTDNEALTVTGTVTDTGTGETVALTTGTGGITLNGVISAAGDTLDLISAVAISQPGGTIHVATLTGSAVTSASLTQASNLVGTLAAFTTSTGFALTDNEALTVTGTVTDTGSSQTVALTTDTGGITLNGVISAAGDTLDLISAGAISQSGGSIDVATLTGSAVTSASLTQATNLVGTLAAFTTGSGFALTDNEALLVSGTVTDTGSAQTVALTTKSGAITLTSVISAANDTLDLISAGAINQTGGSIHVATLTGSAVTSASLAQAGNLVGTLAAFTTSTGFALIDNEALTVTGPFSDAGATSTLALTTTAGDLTLAGNITLGATSVLDLISAGAIDQTGGSITAATLTGSAVTSASLTQATNPVGTLATFTAGTSFALTDNQALTLTGTISAPLININTGSNPLTMAAGTSIVTEGTIAPNQLTIVASQLPPHPPSSTGIGAYFTSGTFQQLGAGTVSTTPGGGPSNVLFITVNNGQNISFAGLTGAAAWLVLDLTAAGSNVTGTVNIKSLTVELPTNSNPANFNVSLTGTVNGLPGQEAAGAAGAIPTKGATIRFNDCPIGTVGCVLLSGALVPVGNPLQYLTLGILVAPNDEGDLLLPLVSDEDFLSCLLRTDRNDCN
jgi:nicotinate-nucleotide pyrophosphorylase